MHTQAVATPVPAPHVDWKGITAYLALAFGLTWVVDFVLIAQGVHFDHMPIWAYLTVAGTMFIPALSGLIVRKWVTREGFATAGLRFGNWRPYVLALVAGPVLFGVVYGLTYLLGLCQLDPSLSGLMASLKTMGKPLPSPGLLATVVGIEASTFGTLITAIATFGEEFGWTGFLLPKLAPLGRWKAVALYGVIWGLWHAPIVAGGYNYPGFGLWAVPMMCVACICIGLLQGSLRLKYGSVFLTSFTHAVINTQARSFWLFLFVNVNVGLGGMTGLVGLATLAAIGWAVMRTIPEGAELHV